MSCEAFIFENFLHTRVTGCLVIMGVILGILQAGTGYFFSKFVTDKGIMMNKLVPLLILACSNITLRYIYHRRVHSESHANSKRLFTNVFAYWLKLNVATQDKHASRMVSALNDSFNGIETAIDVSFKNILLDALEIITFIGGFMYLQPSYTPLLLGWVGLNVALVCYTMKKIAAISAKYQKDYDDFNQEFRDIILNNWNVQYNDLHDYVVETATKQFNRRVDKHAQMINQQMIYSRMYPIILYIMFVLGCIWILSKPLPSTTRVYLIILLMRSYSSYFPFWSNLHEIYHNVQSISPICAVKNEWHDNDRKTVETPKHFTQIEFNNVNYTYPSQSEKTVSNLSFRVHKGQSVALFGRSGVGKSTILHLLLGMMKPQSGTILFNDDLTLTSNQLSKVTGVVPQRIVVFDNMTVRHNIILQQTENDNKLTKLLKFANLPLSVLNKKASTLSIGQKQRLLLTRMLYRPNCQLYILDEYLSAVEEDLAMKIHKRMLQHVRETGKIAIVVTHDMAQANMCDKTIKITKKG